MARNRRDRQPASAVGGNPFTERGFILSGGLLGVGVLCGVLAVFTASGNGSKNSADSASATVTAPLPQLPAPANCPAAPAPTGPDAANGESPNDASWSSYRGLFVPFSNTSGPLAAQGDVARCFAHSQAGALMAAVHISARYALAPDWQAVGQYQIVADADRDAAMQRRAAAVSSVDPSAGPRLDPQRVRQVTGYQVVSYTEAEATVRILTATPSGGTAVSSMYAMVWADGDWKLRMQPNGSTSMATQEVDSPSGFTAWSQSAARP
ncbi:hypothetical protein LO772_22505 [Yinghuangia sp. ASG 101]|uniref:hypothetical protein n=1 Tax=Yinghuangia sp. ASG 101 TaxID=2896848 RepID=UPI001E3EB649|nr:hypothetical protein [Yinghuangia sp. ASG 101]UGQ09677.1 hypothetical protein LO772_22505 [Yinghuangia sp. ASG 101]